MTITITPMTTYYSGTSASPLVSGGTISTARSALSGLGAAMVSNGDYEISRIVRKGYWIKATGSRVTESGWTERSDWDYVIFDPDMKLEKELMAEGWELGGSGIKDDMSHKIFSSLKKGSTNFILVTKEDQWKKWIVATNLLKALNPKTKEERIKLFDTVFGKTPDSKAMEF